MRLKDQSVPNRGERECFISRLSLRLILCAVIGAGCVLTTSAKNTGNELSADTLDARIAILQKRIDSFSLVAKKLRDDSVRAVSAAVSGSGPEAKQLADIDEALAKSKIAAVDMKANYEKARQDSIAVAAKFHDQLILLRKTGDSLDKVIASVRAASATRSVHPVRDSVADGHAVARLQAEQVRDDSLLHVHELALAALSTAADKLTQDSIAAEKRRTEDRDRFRSQLHVLDSQTQVSEAEVSKLAAGRAVVKAQKSRKIAMLQDSIKQMENQKHQFADRIAGLNKDVGILGTERASLAKSAADEQANYAALRAPYDAAVAKAEADVRNLSQEKAVLTALKTKLILDSQVTVASELRDEAMQAQGGGKKGGKSLVDSRQATLDTLTEQRDSIAANTAGLKEREATFSTSASGGIRPLVDNALSANASAYSTAIAARDVARKNQAQFVQANPPVRSAAPIRLALMDSMVVGKKKEAIQLIDWGDSLNILIEAAQKSLTGLTTQSQAEDASSDSLLRAKNDEKATLAKSKAKLLHDNFAADSTDMASILRLRGLVDVLAKQKGSIQAEIDNSRAAIAKVKLDLAAIQERDRQASASASAEKMRADSLQAAQQKELAMLANAQAKNAQDIASVETQQAQQVRAAGDPVAKYAAAIAENNKTTASLQANSEAIKKTLLSGRLSVQETLKKIETELAATGRIIDNDQNRIAALKEQRAAVISGVAQKRTEQDQAMQEFNDLYAMLANKQIDDANKKFKEDRAFLKKNLDEDHFKALKATIQRMEKEGQ